MPLAIYNCRSNIANIYIYVYILYTYIYICLYTYIHCIRYILNGLFGWSNVFNFVFRVSRNARCSLSERSCIVLWSNAVAKLLNYLSNYIKWFVLFQILGLKVTFHTRPTTFSFCIIQCKFLNTILIVSTCYDWCIRCYNIIYLFLI